MSSAQTLPSGLPAAHSSPRSSVSSASGAGSYHDAPSFRDALETASHSRDAEAGEKGRVSPDRARGRKDGRADAGGERDDTASREGAAHRADTASAPGLSAILSVLGGASATADGEAGFAAWRGAAPGGSEVAGESVDEGLLLPGQVGDDGETLDADRLLLLMKSGSASKSTAGPAPAVLDIKVAVTGQKTHLALDETPSDALAKLAAQEAAEAGAQANGNGKAAVLGAALSQAADDVVRSARARDGAAAGDLAFKGDAGATSRAGTIAEDWGGRGSSSLTDQGIAGRDGGRQSDGRGASSGGTQQQGTGAFMAALAGAPQTGAVRNAADGGAGYDPVGDQIAAEVRAELRGGLSKGSSDGVVKVLHLELKPANLGSVTVRLTLKDNAITIHLEAQRTDTLVAIERERQALTGALAAAGYSVDGVTVAPQSEMSRSMASLAGGASDSGASASQGGPSGQASHDQGLGNSSGGQGRSGEAGAGNFANRHPSDDKDASVSGVRRDADGLYV